MNDTATLGSVAAVVLLWNKAAKNNCAVTLKCGNLGTRTATSVSAPPATGCKTDGTNSTLPTSILVLRVSTGKVERVAFKSYVKNVLPNEWITSWPAASLEAGAMAAKSYGW